MAEAGIGVDIVEISQMKSILEKTPSFARRVFTDEERAYCDASLPLIMPAALPLAKRCLRHLERGLVRALDVRTFP